MCDASDGVFIKIALRLKDMNRLLVLSVLLVFLFGCTIPFQKTAVLNEAFQLKVGESASIASEGLTIKLVDVPEDSRCPTDVQCIWAGRTKVALSATKGGVDLGAFNITTEPGAEGSAGAIAGYLVRVSGVSPSPLSTKQIQKSDYLITLIVVKSTALN
jgi:hypothetical protein